MALGIAREHLDDVVVKAVVELPLKRPGKLRMLDFARAKLKEVRVNLGLRGFEADLDFDAVGSGMSFEIEERVLVPRQFLADFLDQRAIGFACRSAS